MGDVFLNALKMIIIPLIVTSLISAITNIGAGKNLGRIGLKTFIYYISTSLLAIIIGLLLNVNVLLLTTSKKENTDIKNRILNQMQANISFSILLSLFTILFF